MPNAERLKVLVVRPMQQGSNAEGDNVVHAKAIGRLSADMDVEVVELEIVGQARRLLNLLRDVPPEIARHMSPANPGILGDAVARFAPDVICLFNETTFTLTPNAKATRAGVVLYAHNVHSQIVDTDKSIAGLLFGNATRRFEQRYYGDVGVDLVCISESDAKYVRAAGLRSEVAVAPPGAPPPRDLVEDAHAEPALVITGSYGWWRKRRDLKRFALESSDPGVACYLSEAAASAVDIAGSRRTETLDWSSALRVGLISDRFVGGFKLKSTEYVALNCAIASYADIADEFAGLPHADEFVRIISSRGEAEAFAKALSADPGSVSRFRDFKAACIQRYDWAHTLNGLENTIRAAADRAR